MGEAGGGSESVVGEGGRVVEVVVMKVSSHACLTYKPSSESWSVPVRLGWLQPHWHQNPGSLPGGEGQEGEKEGQGEVRGRKGRESR